LAGLILNSRNIKGEAGLVERFAQEINTSVVHTIPRHRDVQRAEAKQKTVVEAFPLSPMSQVYRRLAEKVLAVCGRESAGDERNTGGWDNADGQECAGGCEGSGGCDGADVQKGAGGQDDFGGRDKAGGQDGLNGKEARLYV
jgi:hypothetical protein